MATLEDVLRLLEERPYRRRVAERVANRRVRDLLGCRRSYDVHYPPTLLHHLE